MRNLQLREAYGGCEAVPLRGTERIASPENADPEGGTPRKNKNYIRYPIKGL
jgi:hypothetical protein